MKKFTKVALVFAGLFAIIGLICVVASFALGLTWDKVSGMVREGKFNFAISNDGIYVEESEGIVTTVSEEFRNLDIEFSAGTLEVVYADVEEVEVQQENVSGFKRYVKEHTLHIEGGTKIGVNTAGGTIIVRIPKDMIFDEVDLEFGAGEAKLTGLAANSVDIEVGAGEARLVGLDVKELNAETGAGELYVELVGSETDYNYDAECDIGEIKIGTTSISGLGGSKEVRNPGVNRHMDLECGVGQIQIEFQNQGI